MNEKSKAVLGAVAEELQGVVADQQRLADDLTGLMGDGGAALVRRLQEFDRLRQRLELLHMAVTTVTEDAGDPSAAVMARLSVGSVRDVFARHLGLATEDAPADDDVELF